MKGAEDVGLGYNTAIENEAAALRELYAAPLVLLRPDQIVAWRGAAATSAMQVLRQSVGAA